MNPTDPVPCQMSLWHAAILLATGAVIAIIALALAQSDRVIEASHHLEQTEQRTAAYR